MFGRGRPSRGERLAQATELLHSQIASMDLQAAALAHVASSAGAMARKAHADDAARITARMHFDRYTSATAQIQQVLSARSVLQLQLTALQAKALAEANIAALTAAQTVLGNTDSVVDTLEAAIDAGQDTAADLGAVYSAALPQTDDDAFMAFVSNPAYVAPPALLETPISPPTASPGNSRLPAAPGNTFPPAVPNAVSAWLQ